MRINGFTLLEPPYKGGMAMVYKGQRGNFSKAFKIVRADKACNTPKLVQQFLQEIRIQASLNHPNIVRILDAYPYQDSNGMSITILEMEWLNGLDLQRYIEQKAKNGLDETEIKNIALQVLDGLQYAHNHNILHLDIKPSNIFRTDEGYIKIIDFGIAKVIGENACIVDGASTVTIMTETGESSFKGTLAYASPEQYVGAKLGVTSDIYSFGKVLHYLCTGSNDPSIEVKSPKIASIISKCTMANPKKRFQSCNEVKAAFVDTHIEKRNCPQCGCTITNSMKFCPYCGLSLQTSTYVCYSCGKSWTNPASNHKSMFCPYCGSKYIAKVTDTNNSL